MAVNNSLQSRSGGKPKFSVAIQTPMYQKPWETRTAPGASWLPSAPPWP